MLFGCSTSGPHSYHHDEFEEMIRRKIKDDKWLEQSATDKENPANKHWYFRHQFALIGLFMAAAVSWLL